MSVTIANHYNSVPISYEGTIKSDGKGGQRFDRELLKKQEENLPSFIGKVYTEEELYQYADDKVRQNQSNKTSLEDMIKDSCIGWRSATFKFAGETKEQVYFSQFAPNAPAEVKQAFVEASQETGYSAYDGAGKLKYISQILVTQFENRYNGVPNPQDVFGGSVASALRAAKQMLYDLENPLVPISQRGENVAKYVEQEKEFYRKFIEKLEIKAQRSLKGNSELTRLSEYLEDMPEFDVKA